MQHLFRLYYVFIPHLIKLLADDHYAAGDKRSTLLATITLRKLVRGVPLPEQNIDPHKIAEYTQGFFPLQHYILGNISSSGEKSRHQEILIIELSQFLYHHWRNGTLHFVLPWKDEAEEHYRARLRDNILMPLTGQVLKSLEKERAREFEALEQTFIRLKKQRPEFARALEKIGISDEAIKNLLQKPLHEIISDLNAESEVSSLPENENIQFFTFDELGAPVELMMKRAFDQTYEITAILEGKTILSTRLAKENIGRLPLILSKTHELTKLMQERGFDIKDYTLTYEEATDSFIGELSTLEGENYTFSIPSQDITQWQEAGLVPDKDMQKMNIPEKNKISEKETHKENLDMEIPQEKNSKQQVQESASDMRTKEETLKRKPQKVLETETAAAKIETTIKHPLGAMLKTYSPVRFPRRLPSQARIVKDYIATQTRQVKITHPSPTVKNQEKPQEHRKTDVAQSQRSKQQQEAQTAAAPARTPGKNSASTIAKALGLSAAGITAFPIGFSLLSVVIS